MILSELMSRLSHDACILTTKILHKFDNIEPITQIRAEATHCKKIKKIDGKVSFDSALQLYDKYRAFEGWPGIFVDNGTKLFDIELLDNSSENGAGEILAIYEKSILVGCKKGTLKIGRLQPPSKRAMDAKAYCIGRGLKVGHTLF